MSLTFDKLPIELQSQVLRLLDPIALISFSQTCQQFRNTIRPTRQHFVERLLAVECLEEAGGPLLHFRARDNAQEPAWEDGKINDMRWTCTHCLRLLPHMRFDNHSLLRLGFRKPPPGSPAALPCTSWEPNDQVVSRTVQHRRRAASKAEMKRLRRQYAIAVTLNWGRSRQSQSAFDRLTDFQNAEMEPFTALSTTEFASLNTFEETKLLDDVATSVEREMCGYKRRLRKCNECRYQLGDLRSHMVTPSPVTPGVIQSYLAGANLGTTAVPIVRSRQLYIGTRTHRYFPSFLKDMPSWAPEADKAPNFRIYRQDSRDDVFTNYMIRCPGCASWKEMANFRCGNHWPKWWPAGQHRWGDNLWNNWDGVPITLDFINKLRCHTCYASDHGRDALAKVLIQWYTECLISDLWQLQRHLSLGWSLAWDSLDSERMRYVQPGEWFASQRYHFEIRAEVMADLPWTDPHDKRKGISYIGLDTEALQTLSRGHKRLEEKWGTWYKQKPNTVEDPTSEWNDWFNSWMKGYGSLNAQWIWLGDCKHEILKRPEAIVEWALGDNGNVDVQVSDIWKQVTEKLSTNWTSPEIVDI